MLRDTVVIDSLVAYSNGRMSMTGGLGIGSLRDAVVRPEALREQCDVSAEPREDISKRTWTSRSTVHSTMRMSAVMSGFSTALCTSPSRMGRRSSARRPGAVQRSRHGRHGEPRDLPGAVAAAREPANGREPARGSRCLRSLARLQHRGLQRWRSRDSRESREGVARSRRSSVSASAASIASCPSDSRSIADRRLSSIRRAQSDAPGHGGYEVRLPVREAINIRILIGGTLRNPQISLESDAQPPIPQSDLLSYLAFGRSSSSLLQLEGSGFRASNNLVGAGAALASRSSPPSHSAS